MKKRMISFFMVVAIIATTFPFADFLQLNIANAAGETIILDDGRVVTLPPGVPKSKQLYGKTYELNKELLVDSGITSVPNLDSGLAVYGTAKDVSGNEYKQGEWRYLGFDMVGNKYTNPDFPMDADSGRSPSQKDWIKMYDYGLVEKSKYYDDKQQCGQWLQSMVWVRDLERGGKLPEDFDGIWLAEHFHILSPPGEYTAGLARGWHKASSGKLWYETFVMPPEKTIDVPKLPASVTADFELKDEVYEYQDTGYKDISYALGSVIEYRKLTITGDNGYKNEIEDNTNPNIKLKEGTYTFTLYVKNNADQEDTRVKTIKVIKQQADVPSKAIAVINSPNEVPVNQSFAVSSDGSFASTGAKITEYKWYVGTDTTNLAYNSSFDNQPNITVSYSVEGVRIFKLWIKDSSGKEAWSNIASTNIIDGTIASAKAKIDVPDYGYEGVPFDVSTHGSEVTVNDEKLTLRKAVEEGFAKYRVSGLKKDKGFDASGGLGVIEELGEHDISLRISPKNGDDSKDVDYITILPTPAAKLKNEGYLKENRLVILNGNESLFHQEHPYLIDKTYIVIEEVATGSKAKLFEGQAVNNSFMRSKTFSKLKLEAIFKKQGDYKATLYAEDDRGNWDTDEVTFTIAEDKAPKSEFYIKKVSFRDTNTKKGKIEINSSSTSLDSDFIDYKKYFYKFDNDNDNSFNDESWTYAGTSFDSEFTFEVSKVGDYLIKEEVKEKFAQPTIEEFVTDADRKSSTSERTTKIDNKEPISSTLPIKSKSIDVMINYDIADKQSVINSVNSYENSIINDGDCLLKPNTKLNAFYASNDDLILIKQGSEIYPMTILDESEDYLIIASSTGTGYNFGISYAINKTDFTIRGEIPSTNDWIYNRDFEHFKEKTSFFLPNSNYLIYSDKIFDVDTMQEYLLPYPFIARYKYILDSSIIVNGPIPYKDNYYDSDKNIFFYKSDDKVVKYDLNTKTYEISNSINFSKSYIYYSLIGVSENYYYFLNLYYSNGAPYADAKIEIITTDHKGNIVNTSSTNTELTGNSESYVVSVSANYGENAGYYNKDTDSVHIIAEILTRKTNSSDDTTYCQWLRYIKTDRQGNIKKVSSFNSQISVSPSSNHNSYAYVTKVNEEAGTIEIFGGHNGNPGHSYSAIQKYKFDKYGNQLMNLFDYNYTRRKEIENWDSIRFPLGMSDTFSISGEEKIFYVIYDAIKGKAVYSYEGDRDPQYKLVLPIQNSDNEFIHINKYSKTPTLREHRLYDAITNTSIEIPTLSININSNTPVIKMDNKYYFISSTVVIWDKDKNTIKTYNPNFSGFAETTKDNKIIYKNSTSKNYKYYIINPGFFEIVKKIEEATFLNNDRYIVIMTNDKISYTSDDASRLINAVKTKNAKVIWYGNSNNQALANSIISQTGGYFRSYSTYTNMMNDLASILKQDNNDLSDRERTLYVKKGESISYERMFADYEDDPQYTPSGEKWLYNHNPNYYAKNDGLASFHNKWLTAPITSFDKVGKYTVTFLLRDNPVGADNRFDTYRKWSEGLNTIDIIVYDDDSTVPPEPEIPLQLSVDISGDLRENHRVDFEITAIKGSSDINYSTLNISFDKTDYLPYTKPNTMKFSRVFKNTGAHSITVTLKDVKGKATTITVPFTINTDQLPVSDLKIIGDGRRNESGIAEFEVTDNSYSTDDAIGSIEYFIEDTKYIDSGDGTFIPSGIQFYSLNMDNGKLDLNKIGSNRIKQKVTETYINGTGLNGEDLDQYRVFRTIEVIKTLNVNNEAPTLNYQVKPNIILTGESINHVVNVQDDTPSGDTLEYKFIHDSSYYQSSHGTHINNNVITTEGIEILDKKGKYDFYCRAIDEDGSATEWVYGGQVLVVSEPVSNFVLESQTHLNDGKNTEIQANVFTLGSVITVQNSSFNEDYLFTTPNHGISYYKLEYRKATDSDFTTVCEYNNLVDYVNEINLPAINENGIYEVKQTVGSPEGYYNTLEKQFTVLDLRMDAELEPNKIYASQSYKIKAKLSKDGFGAVAYIPYTNQWVTLDKVNEDAENKYYEKEVSTAVTLKDDVYDIKIYGIYPYNNEIEKILPLTVNTPIELKSDIKPDGPNEYIRVIQDNLDSNDYIELPAGEKIKIAAEIISPVVQEYVKAKLEGEGEIDLVFNSTTGKYEALLNVPSIKPDKDYYTLNINTRTPNGNTVQNTHRVKLLTPINLIANMPNEVVEDTTAVIKAETSKYVEHLTVKLFKGKTFEKTVNLTSKLNGNKKEWSYAYEVPTGLPEGVYTAEFRAVTYNNNVDIKNETFKLQTLNLKDLRITNMINHPQYDGKYPILYSAPSVPVNYKTGYYVTFKIDAQGDPDAVKMKISYPGYNKTFNMTKESQNGSDSVWRLEWYSDPFTPKGTVINTVVTAEKDTTILNFNSKYGFNGDYLKVTGSIEGDVRIDQEY